MTPMYDNLSTIISDSAQTNLSLYWQFLSIYHFFFPLFPTEATKLWSLSQALKHWPDSHTMRSHTTSHATLLHTTTPTCLWDPPLFLRFHLSTFSLFNPFFLCFAFCLDERRKPKKNKCGDVVSSLPYTLLQSN